jgi:hypothetical protein
MMAVALAASCATTKKYSSKLFKMRDALAGIKDSGTVALRFLDLEQTDPDAANWISTEIIMGRDSSSATGALDNLAKVFPARPAVSIAKDSVAASGKENELLQGPAPIASTGNTVEQHLVRNNDPGVQRVKRIREEK